MCSWNSNQNTIKKNGEFAGTCSSNNPFLKKEEPCQFCGAKPDEKCKKE